MENVGHIFDIWLNIKLVVRIAERSSLGSMGEGAVAAIIKGRTESSKNSPSFDVV